MATKVLNIQHGRYSCVCIKDEDGYKLYKTWTDLNQYGYPAKHRKMVAKYAGFADVLIHVGAAASGAPSFANLFT